jgi:hypothetical protein
MFRTITNLKNAQILRASYSKEAIQFKISLTCGGGYVKSSSLIFKAPLSAE